MQWKSSRMFRKFEIMAFEHVSGIFLNSDKNIWEQQSTCYQTVPKFQIWQKDVFSNRIFLGLMEISYVSAAVLIPAVIVTRERFDSPKVC